MSTVVVFFTDGKEVLFENAYFSVNHDQNVLKIYNLKNNLLAIFNFDNIVGAKLV